MASIFTIKEAIDWCCDRGAMVKFDRKDSIKYIQLEVVMQNGEKLRFDGIDLVDLAARAKSVWYRRGQKNA